jgi:hypothetical protein
MRSRITARSIRHAITGTFLRARRETPKVEVRSALRDEAARLAADPADRSETQAIRETMGELPAPVRK